MERVNEGERYWFIRMDSTVTVLSGIEDGEGACECTDNRFELGNYFNTKEMAERAAELLRKVMQDKAKVVVW